MSAFLMSDAANTSAPPPVLLPYQQAWIADQAQLKVAEKSRRIGLTWAEAADDVLIAAGQGGTNVFYIGPTADMALEYIEACAMWARAYNMAATEIEQGILLDEDGTKEIKTFKIDFPGSGRRIVALSSRPTNLRGKQGVIVIDEGAFHNDLFELLKAAMAMLLWGDKLRVISTHDGVDNAFNELIQDIRAGKRGSATVHRITFMQAVEQGLYQRVCLRRGLTWSQAAEDKWVADAYAFYGDAASEELDVVPSQSGGAYLTMAMIEARMSTDTPLIRKRFTDEFGQLPELVRRGEVHAWCEEELLPILKRLDPLRMHGVGEDFGRVSDLTVIMVGAEEENLTIRVRLQVELSNCPFRQQEQILFYIMDWLKRLRGGAFDATGNGAALAEYAADRYGSTRIEQVKLNDSFYLEHFPKFKAAIEDGTFDDLPKDVQTRDDLRAVQVINGIPKLPKAKTQIGDGQKLTRHGDAAVAAVLLHYAMKRDVVDINGLKTSGSKRTGYQINDFMG